MEDFRHKKSTGLLKLQNDKYANKAQQKYSAYYVKESLWKKQLTGDEL
jgi:hypothetical protein